MLFQKIVCVFTVVIMTLYCCCIVFAEEIILQQNNDIKMSDDIQIIGGVQMGRNISFIEEECESKVFYGLNYALGLEHLDCACKVMLWSSNQIETLKSYENERNKSNIETTDSSKIRVDISEFYIPIETISDIENEAQYIVKAKVLENSKNILTPEGGGYTETDIEITDIYKGNLNIGDTITLVEPYYTSKKGLEYRRDGYSASEVGEEYLFFIRTKYDDETYGMVCTIFGRYLLDDTKEDMIEYNVLKEYTLLYRQLKKEAISIYKK